MCCKVKPHSGSQRTIRQGSHGEKAIMVLERNPSNHPTSPLLFLPSLFLLVDLGCYESVPHNSHCAVLAQSWQALMTMSRPPKTT